MMTNTKVAVHLVKGGGEQHAEDFKKLNPMEQVRLGVTCGQCHLDPVLNPMEQVLLVIQHNQIKNAI